MNSFASKMLNKFSAFFLFLDIYREKTSNGAYVFFPAVSTPSYPAWVTKESIFYCLNVTSKFSNSGLLIYKTIDFEKGSTVVKRQFITIFFNFEIRKEISFKGPDT